MTGTLSKIAISVATTGVGGLAIGVPLSASSNQLKSVNTVSLSSTPSLDQQENIEQEIHSVSEPSVDTQPQSSYSESFDSLGSSHSEEDRGGSLQTQTLEAEGAELERTQELEEVTPLQDDPEGNCTVLGTLPEKIKKLSDAYVAVSCKNDVDDDSSSLLSKWRGYFPTSLLTGGVEKFRESLKLKIDVRELKNNQAGDSSYGEEADLELYETIFTGEKFLKQPLTGRWGSTFLSNGEEDTEDDLAIYVVNLSKSDISSDFYVLPEYDG